jgi:hypothetical protein
MKKKSFYHRLKTKAALTLALLVASVMTLDAAGTPFAVSGANVLSGGKMIIEVKSKLERIYGVVDMPVKIVNAMFEKDGFAQKLLPEVLQETIIPKALYSTLRAAKPFERAGLTKNPAVTASPNKKQIRALQSYFIQNCFFIDANSSFKISGNEIKLIFLFLMLIQACPRDIPLTKNQTNL